MSYYSNVNPDLLQRVPLTARNLLEVGCGAGAFAEAFLSRQPQACYSGIELDAQAGALASTRLHRVLTGDIEKPETLAQLDEQALGKFDTLILGDVLEHLRDPWQTLKHLGQRMQQGALALACIPNVAHWSVLFQMLQGRWDYTDSGLLDKTHLRFFTLETAREMFERSGWQVLDAVPRQLWPEQTAAALAAIEPLAHSLGIAPEHLRRNQGAFQWVLRARWCGMAKKKALVAPMTLAGLGLKRVAGVTEARIDYPLQSLATLPSVRAVWGAGDLKLPADCPPGILILHRQFLSEPQFNARLEAMIAQGWLVVSDMDDDPHHWRQFVANDFLAYRGVHAVTVSTEPLAEMIREWNPNVRVFGNALHALPQIQPEVSGSMLRVFFGALNRDKDWAAILAGLTAVADEMPGRLHFVVVHDRGFYDALPQPVSKEFHPTLPHPDYLRVMAGCDVALLPLVDNAFNRLKSDLKFIECCAAGVVPLCSAVVYAEHPRHREIGMFAESAEEWAGALRHLAEDTEDRLRRRDSGRAYVREERMHAQQVEARLAYYTDLLHHREELEQQRRERLRGKALCSFVPSAQ